MHMNDKKYSYTDVQHNLGHHPYTNMDPDPDIATTDEVRKFLQGCRQLFQLEVVSGGGGTAWKILRP